MDPAANLNIDRPKIIQSIKVNDEDKSKATVEINGKRYQISISIKNVNSPKFERLKWEEVVNKIVEMVERKKIFHEMGKLKSISKEGLKLENKIITHESIQDTTEIFKNLSQYILDSVHPKEPIPQAVAAPVAEPAVTSPNLELVIPVKDPTAYLPSTAFPGISVNLQWNIVKIQQQKMVSIIVDFKMNHLWRQVYGDQPLPKYELTVPITNRVIQNMIPLWNEIHKEQRKITAPKNEVVVTSRQPSPYELTMSIESLQVLVRALKLNSLIESGGHHVSEEVPSLADRVSEKPPEENFPVVKFEPVSKKPVEPPPFNHEVVQIPTTPEAVRVQPAQEFSIAHMQEKDIIAMVRTGWSMFTDFVRGDAV